MTSPSPKTILTRTPSTKEHSLSLPSLSNSRSTSTSQPLITSQNVLQGQATKELALPPQALEGYLDSERVF